MFLYFFFLMLCPPPISTLFPYTTLFRSHPSSRVVAQRRGSGRGRDHRRVRRDGSPARWRRTGDPSRRTDRKSTRLNSSHGYISYAVFCLKKKKKKIPIKY